MWATCGKIVVAVNSRNLFQQIDLALQHRAARWEPAPHRNCHPERAAARSQNERRESRAPYLGAPHPNGGRYEAQPSQNPLNLALADLDPEIALDLERRSGIALSFTSRPIASMRSPSSSPPALCRISSATRAQASGVVPIIGAALEAMRGVGVHARAAWRCCAPSPDRTTPTRSARSACAR